MESPDPLICGICLDSPDVPHHLPCSHTFCFLCIMQHLALRNFCPVCRGGVFGMDSLSTRCVKRNAVKLPNQIFKRSAANYIHILKRHQVRTDGSLEQLEWRFAELLRQTMLEQFREHPASLAEVAWRVHSKEQRVGRKKRGCTEEVLKCLLQLKARIALLGDKSRRKSDM